MKAKLTDPRDLMTPSWDLVQPSVRLLREHYLAAIYLFFLPGLLYVLGSLLASTAGTEHISLQHLTGREVSGFVVLGIGGLWSLINLAPSLLFRVTAVRGQTLALGDYYRQGLPLFFRLIGLYIVTGLVILLGFIALIVPAFIFFRRYYLAPYYLVDQNTGIRESMRLSSRQSRPVAPYVWGIVGVQFVFSIFASFCSIIPAVGVIVGEIVGYLCLFLPALRYLEIRTANATQPKPPRAKGV